VSGTTNGDQPELPEGWEWKALGEIARTSSGGTPSRKRPEFYTSGTIPWLKIGDLNDGVVTVVEESITEEALESSSARLLPEGTLLIAMYGSIGKLGFLGTEAATNQAICALETDLPELRHFLYWYLRLVAPQLLADGYGGTQANISQTYLKQVLVPVPPADEQRRIVASLERLVEGIQAGERSVLDSLGRLPAMRRAVLNAAFKDGQALPSNWRRCAVSDVGRVITGNTPSKVRSEYYGDAVPLIKPTQLRGGEIEPGDDWLSLEGAAVARVVEEGAVLTCCIGATIGKVGLAASRISFNQQINAVVFDDDVLPAFGLLYLSGMRPWLVRHSTATAIPQVNKTTFSSLPIVVPPVEDQEEILRSVNHQLAQLKQLAGASRAAMEQAARLRRSTLHRAFIGKLPIPAEITGVLPSPE